MECKESRLQKIPPIFDVSQKVKLSTMYVWEVEKIEDKLKCQCQILDPSIQPTPTIVISNAL